MAIQMRRGPYAQFDPTRLLPGEIAVVTANDPNTLDGKAAYICLAAGDVRRIVTADELAAALANLG
jgi:hypothetical protein